MLELKRARAQHGAVVTYLERITEAPEPAQRGKRRRGPRHEWYQVEVRGRSVTCTGGRIGREGQLYALAHLDSVHQAQLWAQDRVRDKLRKGYAVAVPGQVRPRSVQPPHDPRQLPLGVT